MTPKKAIIIVLVLFLIMAMVFAFLYLKKQLTVTENQRPSINGQTGATNKNEPPTPSEVIQQKIDQIVEDAQKNPAQSTPDQVRQEVISTINAEIMKLEQNKTPEQRAAELKALEERQKIIDQINNQIKQTTTK